MYDKYKGQIQDILRKAPKGEALSCGARLRGRSQGTQDAYNQLYLMIEEINGDCQLDVINKENISPVPLGGIFVDGDEDKRPTYVPNEL
jgi:hypothetical protein